MVRPYCWQYHTLESENISIPYQSSGYWYGRSFIPTCSNFQSSERCHLHHWRRKEVIHLTQLWTLGATVLLIGLVRHAHFCTSGVTIMEETSHYLIRINSVPQDETYTWHHFLFQAKNLRPDRSQALGDNLLLLFFEREIVLNSPILTNCYTHRLLYFSPYQRSL